MTDEVMSGNWVIQVQATLFYRGHGMMGILSHIVTVLFLEGAALEQEVS